MFINNIENWTGTKMFLSFLTQPHRPFCDVSVELLGWTGSGVDLWPVQTRAGSAWTYTTHPAVWPLLPGYACRHVPLLTRSRLGTLLTRPEHYTELFFHSFASVDHFWSCFLTFVQLCWSCNFYNPLTDFLLTWTVELDVSSSFLFTEIQRRFKHLLFENWAWCDNASSSSPNPCCLTSQWTRLAVFQAIFSNDRLWFCILHVSAMLL